MAGEAEALANVGATAANLSEGQSTNGAPKAPVINNNPNGSGDGVVPKDDAAKVAAAEAAAKKAEEEAAAAKSKEEDEEEEVLVQYEDWEDPSANAVVDLLKEAGVSAAEARPIFQKAVESGDLRDIDVKALEAKLGKSKALLAMNGIKEYYQRNVETANQTVTTVKQVFGGEQGWETVKAWAQAKEKVDPAFKKELDSIRDDFNSGNQRAAKAAAKDLLKLYNGAGNTKGLGNGNIKKPTGTEVPRGDNSPMSRSEYTEALKKAHASGANRTVIAQLDARRRAGMQAGI